jgi:hypothetical protein
MNKHTHTHIDLQHNKPLNKQSIPAGIAQLRSPDGGVHGKHIMESEKESDKLCGTLGSSIRESKDPRAPFADNKQVNNHFLARTHEASTIKRVVAPLVEH